MNKEKEVRLVKTFILRRMLFVIPLLFLISLISFIVIEAPPGDYLTSMMIEMQQQFGPAAARQVDILRQAYGLDQPVYVRYYRWMKNILLYGEFGYSFAEGRRVTDIIRERLPLTILITSVTLLFTWIVAVPLGVLSAVKRYSWYDYFMTFISFIGYSIPNFLLALVLMYFFYNNFGWTLGGLFSAQYQGAPWDLAKIIDLARHLILPVIVIGTAGTASMVRILRSMMIDELKKEYTQTARAKGLKEILVVWKHAFRIAILPLISTIGWLLPTLVSGEMITSIVLNLPTTGARLYTALLTQDSYVSGAFILLLSTFTIVGTLVSDILLAQVDPRIRYD